MSFTGSLVLSGIGGLVFKYGGQQSEKEKDVPTGFRDLTLGFIEAKGKLIRERSEAVTINFWRELVQTGAYQYPIRVRTSATLKKIKRLLLRTNFAY